MDIQKVSIGKLKRNKNNPRTIKDDKFTKLVKSIKDFPKMLEIRPIVVDNDYTVLGGNMRLSACKEAGLEFVDIILADSLTEEEKKEFIVKDNVAFGEWDYDLLSVDYEADLLENWGLDVPDLLNDTEDSDPLEDNEEKPTKCCPNCGCEL